MNKRNRLTVDIQDLEEAIVSAKRSRDWQEMSLGQKIRSLVRERLDLGDLRLDLERLRVLIEAGAIADAEKLVDEVIERMEAAAPQEH